jgi:hypothetical protein
MLDRLRDGLRDTAALITRFERGGPEGSIGADTSSSSSSFSTSVSFSTIACKAAFGSRCGLSGIQEKLPVSSLSVPVLSELLPRSLPLRSVSSIHASHQNATPAANFFIELPEEWTTVQQLESRAQSGLKFMTEWPHARTYSNELHPRTYGSEPDRGVRLGKVTFSLTDIAGIH